MCKIGKYIFIAVLLCFITISAISATGLKNGMGGRKNIALNNKVGANIVKFTSSAPLEEIKGSADKISGGFTLNLDNLEAAQGNIVVDATSMQTGITKRDKHLLSKEWLEADAYPTISFRLTTLESIQITSDESSSAEIKATAIGTFTLHGESKDIKAPITIKYIKESAATQQRASGDLAMITGRFQIALKDFKIFGTGGYIGKKVGETIAVEFSLFGSTNTDGK